MENQDTQNGSAVMAELNTSPEVVSAIAPEPRKTLDEYAKAILEAHQSVDHAESLSKRHGREAIASAIKAGQYLNDAKALVGHGNWLRWLKENCKGISEKTAQRYMTLAKSVTVSDLKECSNLRQAYIRTGAIKAGHLDKNPDEEPTPNENEPVEVETPLVILAKLERKFAGCKSLYKSLVKASPELENSLFDTCEPSLWPLPILLERWHYSVNDALSYFGLPTIQVACVRCGRVKEPDDAFVSIYPDMPEYSGRLEWCEDCFAHHATSKHGMDIAKEIPALTENLTELKSLPVKDYTFAQKFYQLVGNTVAEPSVIQAAEKNVWAPADFGNEPDTIAAIQRLSPQIVIVRDKDAHQLWNVYRHFVSSAVNYQTPGRYIKFFVIDGNQSANPVLGIGAISGDFPALGPRDDFIGWTKEQKEDGKLNHTAVASTIVSMQPFGFNFNGGKLMAALTTSRQIRDEWQSQYGDVLVGMTTTSLFGVPSMYDQIDEWKRLGETTGRVPIQPKPDIYRKWLAFIKNSRAHEFREVMTQDADVSGPVTNYKTKVLTMIYRAAGLKLADFQHGHCRGIYFSEFYQDTREFLCGRVPEDDLKMKPLFQETVQQITDRWRTQAVTRYRNLKAKGQLKPEKHSYSQLGKMDFQAAREAFLDEVGR